MQRNILRTLLLLTWTSLVYAQIPIEIRQLQKTGVIFENIGQAVIQQNKWTILTQINIPRWNETAQFIDSCEQIFETLCTSLQLHQGQNNCKHWVTEVNFRTSKIRSKIEEIENYFQCQHPRRKRGLLNAGGSLAKFLFGSMDHEDSEQINTKLNELEMGNKQSINLAKQQLSLMKANSEIMGQSLFNLTKQQNSLIERTNRFNKMTAELLKNTTDEINYIRVMSETNELALFTLNELQKLTEQVTSAYLVSESLQRHELNPLMINSNEFDKVYYQITNSQEKLGSNLARRIAKTYSQCVNDRIMIKIVVPMFEPLKFTVNQIYLIPIQLSDGTYTILNKIPSYLLNNTFAQKYYEMDEFNFGTTCTPINHTLFVCQRQGPIQITPGEETCVQNLFKTSDQNPTLCEHKILQKANNFLLPMKHENSWLYWLHVPTAV